MLAVELKRVSAAITQQGWIREFKWFDSIDSTNSYAKRSALVGELGPPALFVAGQQTAGRGRSDHQWWSPNGCLMLTLAIDQDSSPPQFEMRPLLALYVGIAVARTAEIWLSRDNCQLAEIQLKWPNDVYAGPKKLGGILIESAPASGNGPAAWLIGIGLNVNVDWSTAPPSICQKATCISSALGQTVPMDAALVHLVEEIHTQVQAWQAGSTSWLPEWTQRCLLSGKVVRARSGKVDVIGRCEGVDSRGRLLIRDEYEVHELQAAEVLDWQ